MTETTMTSNGVTATLLGVVSEIDDEDLDVIEISVDVLNTTNVDLWDIRGDLQAMNGAHGAALAIPERIDAGDGDSMTFWLPANSGTWLFKLDYNTDGGHGSVELGPFAEGMRMESTASPTRQKVSAVGSSEMKTAAAVSEPMFAAFEIALEDFGDMSVHVNETVLTEAASSDNPVEAAFAGGLIESASAPAQPTPSPTPEPMAQPTHAPIAPVAQEPSPAPVAQPTHAPIAPVAQEPSPAPVAQPTHAPIAPVAQEPTPAPGHQLGHQLGHQPARHRVNPQRLVVLQGHLQRKGMAHLVLHLLVLLVLANLKGHPPRT